MEWTCAVDRVEGSGADAIAVVIGDDERVLEVSARELGELAVEGAVLRVPHSGGHVEWAAARRDLEEEARRRSKHLARLERLRSRDPGGDLKL